MTVKVERKANLLFINIDGISLPPFTFRRRDVEKTRKEIDKFLDKHFKGSRYVKSEIYKQLAEIYYRDVEAWEKGAYTPSYYDNRYIVEQVYNPDDEKIQYVVYDSEKDEWSFRDKFEAGNKILYPIDSEDVYTYQVLLPSKPVEYGSTDELFKEVRDFLNRWHEELDSKERLIDTSYVFETWVYDPLPEIPYRRALGMFGGGKSTRLEAMGWISYRGMVLAGANSDADLKRMFDLWRGTAIIDEADFSRSDLYSTIIKILNIGYSNKMGWLANRDKEDPKKRETFRVFGPKLLATRERFKDPALESRCLTVISHENVNKMPLYRNEKFKAEALVVRNKLLLWRFHNLHNLIWEIREKIEDPYLDEKIYGEVLNVMSRIKQITIPLALISPPSMLDEIKDLAKRIDEEVRNLDEDYSYMIGIKEEIGSLIADLFIDLSLKNMLNEGDEDKDVLYEERIGLIKVLLKKVALNVTGIPDDPRYIKQIKSYTRKFRNILKTRLDLDTKYETGRKTYIVIPKDKVRLFKNEILKYLEKHVKTLSSMNQEVDYDKLSKILIRFGLSSGEVLDRWM